MRLPNLRFDFEISSCQTKDLTLRDNDWVLELGHFHKQTVKDGSNRFFRYEEILQMRSSRIFCWIRTNLQWLLLFREWTRYKQVLFLAPHIINLGHILSSYKINQFKSAYLAGSTCLFYLGLNVFSVIKCGE